MSDNDLSSMDKHEASKFLFTQINWQEFVRAGVFLSQSEVRITKLMESLLNFSLFVVLAFREGPR